jgi:DNA polymerase III gamma/tau subunit
MAKRFQQFDLVKIIQELSDLESRFRILPSPRVALEMLLIRLAHLGGEVSVESILSKLSALEKRMKSAGGNPPAPATTDGGSPLSPATTSVSEAAPHYPDGIEETEADFEKDSPPAEEEPQPQLDLWNQFLGEVQKHQMSVFSFLNRGNFCGMENDQMIISFPNEHSYNKEYLERKDQKMLLEGILRAVAGRKAGIKLILEETPSPPLKEEQPGLPLAQAAPPQEDKEQLLQKALQNPVVKKALELFNGKIICVNG